jgi:hypothetical protein
LKPSCASSVTARFNVLLVTAARRVPRLYCGYRPIICAVMEIMGTHDPVPTTTPGSLNTPCGESEAPSPAHLLLHSAAAAPVSTAAPRRSQTLRCTATGALLPLFFSTTRPCTAASSAPPAQLLPRARSNLHRRHGPCPLQA